MNITHNIGMLGAQLKLTAIASPGGPVITEGLEWRITSIGDHNESPQNDGIHTIDPKPILLLKPGNYTVVAQYHSQDCNCGEIALEQNTCTDIVYILDQCTDNDDEYFAQFEPKQEETLRREIESAEQSEYASRAHPLSKKTDHLETGITIQSHPILGQRAQHDGIPPSISPRPDVNEEALDLELTLRAQAQQEASPTNLPKPI